MTDVARLGLAIDSSQAKTAATDLDRFQASANQAAAATDKLAASSTKSNAAGKTVKDAAAGAAQGHNALTIAATKAAGAADTLTKSSGLARHELVNLSRQAQDIGVSLASGQSPFTVLIQQGAQVGDIFSSTQGTIGGFGRQVAGALTPARLLAGGVVGIGAAFAYAMVSVVQSAKAFDDVSRSIGTTTGQLHSLQQAASFKGIGQDDFLKTMQQFGGAVYEAQHNMGGLADVMRNNGKSAKDFNGYLEQAADLIKNAASDQARLQLLQQMGLPATMDWVRFLSQGKDGIRKATEEAAKFNDSAEGKLIASARKFDDAWNTATTKLVSSFKAAMVDIAGAMAGVQVPQWLVNVGRGAFTGAQFGGIPGAVAGGIYGASKGNEANFGDRFGSFTPTTGALQNGIDNRAKAMNGAKSTVDPNAARNELGLEQQRLGILSQLGRVEDAVLSKENEIKLARMNGVKVTKDEAAAIVAVTRAQAEMSRVSQQATIGTFDLAKAQQAANDNLKSMVAQGLLDPNNPKQWAAANVVAAKSLEQLSDQAKIAGSNFEQLKRYQLDATNTRTLFDGFSVRSLDTFADGLTSVVTGTKNVKTAFSDMAKSIIADLAKIAIKQAIVAPIAGGLQSLGGLFGLGTPTLTASGGISGAIGATSVGGAPLVPPAYASGTNFAPGGPSMVNEKGGEIIDLPTGARVIPHDLSKQMLSGGTTVSFGDTNVNLYGNTDEYGLSQVRKELAAHRQALAGIAGRGRKQERFAATGVG